MRAGPFAYSCTSPGGWTIKAPGVTATVCSRRAHRAAAGEAEVDFGRLGMAVVGADLAGLPARDGYVAVGNLAENLLDVVPGVPLLLAFQAEDMHGDGAPANGH